MATPTAVGTIGSIGAYHSEIEKIESYLERVELYMLANNFPEDRKVPALLTLVGASTYELLRSLVAPALPQTKSYDELVRALKKHYSPTPLTIAERFHFHRRSQKPEETIAEYMAELRMLTAHCQFGDYQEQALRDRLVCGLRSEPIQKRLLSESDLTLERAVTLAQSLESADRNVKSLKDTEAEINRLGKSSSQFRSTTSEPERQECYHCGRTNHFAAKCRFKNAECHNCGQRGHIAAVCQGPKQSGTNKSKSHQHFKSRVAQAKWVEQEETTATSVDEEELPIYSFTGNSEPIQVELFINSKSLCMEIDTGAAVSLVSESKWQELFPEVIPRETEVILRTYTGERMNLVGEVDVEVQYENQRCQLPLVITAGSGPALFGRDWLRQIQVNWKAVSSASVNKNSKETLKSVIKKYEGIFSDGLGHIHPYQADLSMKPEAKPKFHRPRPVPYAIRGAIEDELDRMEEAGILEKIPHSDWAAPIVAVPKRDGRYRICGDYKVTINSELEVDQYPLPKPEDLFATLSGGQKFTTLDLSQAYLQLSLSEESRQYTTVNTHKGLYRFKRLPFGVASAPSIFQKTLDTILEGIPKVLCYIDDILITGRNDVEHLENLVNVLQRLEEHGLRIKLQKCSLMANSVDYLGHRIDAQGLHALSDKVDAITKAPVPKNIGELRSFLGLLNYYRKFLPNVATVLKPLHELLEHNKTWKWSSKCTAAFKQAKELLTTSNVLVHYNASLPIRMAADASSHGIGAVISHVMSNGEEKPIAYASRTLSSSEYNYAQIEKEALALVFGVRKFHQYLYGKKFTMVTDHRPLTTILGPKKGIPPIAAARLQRWAMQLSAFCYDIKFKSTEEHGNADALSRLPLPCNSESSMSDATVYNTRQIASLPVSNNDVEQATRNDPVLGKVLEYTQQGWPQIVGEDFKAYYSRRDELVVEGHCLLWGTRVVIPTKLRNRLLEELHQEHPGVSRMKYIARSYLWWPGLDRDLESVAKSCIACQAVKHSPAVAPLHPWTWPSRPWQRVHIDFAGPFQGKMFLLAVDAHSKWGEILEMSQTTTTKTISQLRQLFAAYGLPEQVVSDNGPQFVADEFREFMKSNGIRHIRCSPYHPSSNGLVERFVRTFKEAMKVTQHSQLSLSHRLQNFLLTYRSTPHATTKQTPCMLFMGRSLRTKLDLLKPRLQGIVEEKQQNQKSQHDQHARGRELDVGRLIMARNMRPGEAWVPGVIVKQLGPVSYLVDVGEGRVWKRHIDHLKQRELPVCNDSTAEEPIVATDPPEVGTPPAREPQVPAPCGFENLEESTVSEVIPAAARSAESETLSETRLSRSHQETTSRRSTFREPYPTRQRKPPDWLHPREH